MRSDDAKRNPRHRSRGAKVPKPPIEKAPSLRETSHGPHSKEDIHKLFAEAANSSDRNTCIILSAYLERSLIHLLQTRLKLSDSGILSLLRDRDGPFSRFYSNIIFAKALGLLDKSISSDLDAIRRIRNAFAHTPLPIDFTTSDVNRDIEKLKNYQTSLPSIIDEFPEFTEQKAKFYACFMTLFEIMNKEIIKEIERIDNDILLRRYYRTAREYISRMQSLQDKS